MRVATVESTTLATVGYDEARRLLQLEFCGSGAVYLYFGVPAALHQALLDAPSKGRYFNGTIRGRFPYRQVLDLNTAPRGAAMPAECDR
jgi:KTSC domain-containing protein